MNAAQASAEAPVFGWDVGGAHVKVSMASRSGVLADVAQWACPLWQGLSHLERAIDAVFERWPAARDGAARHAVTMTGEMVDLFADRAEGVRVLASALAQRLGPRTLFYAGAAGWLARSACADGWRKVASANWHASAQWVATRIADALFVDIGSTTTDIIPIVEGRVAARGSNDADRLVSGELVYQGVVRTPLCGVAHRIAFRGETTSVMNEWFATSADVYRLTDELWPPHDQHPSADNGPKTEAREPRASGAHDRPRRRRGERCGMAPFRRRVAARAVAGDRGEPGARVRGASGACGGADRRRGVRAVSGGGACEAGSAQLCRFRDAGGCGHECGCRGAEWIATCAPSVAVALLAASATSIELLPRAGGEGQTLAA